MGEAGGRGQRQMCMRDGVGDGDDEPMPALKKKRKLHADTEEADSAVITEADPGITLRVACLDGSSLDLKVPPRELVREVKRLVGQVRSGEFRKEGAAEDTNFVLLVCAVARHGPGPDRALRRRHRERAA